MKKVKNQGHPPHVGKINMKSLLLNTLISVLAMVNFNAFSQQEKENASEPVDMKCYAEVLGGGFMIQRHYKVPAEQVKNYKHTLKELSAALNKNSQSKVIHRVIECKKMREQFRNKNAVKLEKLEENMG